MSVNHDFKFKNFFLFMHISLYQFQCIGNGLFCFFLTSANQSKIYKIEIRIFNKIASLLWLNYPFPLSLDLFIRFPHSILQRLDVTLHYYIHVWNSIIFVVLSSLRQRFFCNDEEPWFYLLFVGIFTYLFAEKKDVGNGRSTTCWQSPEIDICFLQILLDFLNLMEYESYTANCYSNVFRIQLKNCCNNPFIYLLVKLDNRQHS